MQHDCWRLEHGTCFLSVSGVLLGNTDLRSARTGAVGLHFSLSTVESNESYFLEFRFAPFGIIWRPCLGVSRFLRCFCWGAVQERSKEVERGTVALTLGGGGPEDTCETTRRRRKEGGSTHTSHTPGDPRRVGGPTQFYQ